MAFNEGHTNTRPIQPPRKTVDVVHMIWGLFGTFLTLKELLCEQNWWCRTGLLLSYPGGCHGGW